MTTTHIVHRVVKKPVVVEAAQFTGGAENASAIIDWITQNGGTATWNEAYEAWRSESGIESYPAKDEGLHISTLEGTMTASVGDWVIRGIEGEFYPCRHDIFVKTYAYVDTAGEVT